MKIFCSLLFNTLYLLTKKYYNNLRKLNFIDPEHKQICFCFVHLVLSLLFDFLLNFNSFLLWEIFFCFYFKQFLQFSILLFIRVCCLVQQFASISVLISVWLRKLNSLFYFNNFSYLKFYCFFFVLLLSSFVFSLTGKRQ